MKEFSIVSVQMNLSTSVQIIETIIVLFVEIVS